MTMTLTQPQAERVTALATKHGVGADQFLAKLIDQSLDRAETVQNAADYVLGKNDELYRRLAK